MSAFTDERNRILHMVETGQITAEQAAQLLDAMGSERPDTTAQWQCPGGPLAQHPRGGHGPSPGYTGSGSGRTSRDFC